jgi:hypothetical protein
LFLDLRLDLRDFLLSFVRFWGGWVLELELELAEALELFTTGTLALFAGTLALFAGTLALFAGTLALFAGTLALFAGTLALFAGTLALLFAGALAGLLNVGRLEPSSIFSSI